MSKKKKPLTKRERIAIVVFIPLSVLACCTCSTFTGILSSSDPEEVRETSDTSSDDQSQEIIEQEQVDNLKNIISDKNSKYEELKTESAKYMINTSNTYQVLGVDINNVDEISHLKDTLHKLEESIEELNSKIEEAKTSEYKVLEVIDGDTIKIDYYGNQETARLIGIDTPETKHPSKHVECFGKEASEKMRNILSGNSVRIQFDPTQGYRDKYDRLLLYIWHNQTFVNQVMIEEGFAHEYTYNTPYEFQAEFQKYENNAREQKLGLWGDACKCNKDEEKSRDCIECNMVKVIYYNWDCSTYNKKITDTSCSNLCPIYEPEPVIESAPQPSPETNFICDCSKTCSQMHSCEEAKFQLFDCGCNKRDGDNDGVPCEEICPGG